MPPPRFGPKPHGTTCGAEVKGIRRDRYGFRAYVKVGAVQREKRFPADTLTKTMQNWRDDTKVALRKITPRVTRDTLRADAKRYLAHMKTQLVPSGYASRVCEVDAWLKPFGHVPRHLITRQMVLDERQRWLTDRHLAPKTCNHRVRVLRHLYRYCDGSKAESPCDDIDKLQEPPAQPHFVSPAVIRRVLGKITDPKDRARFMVLTATGQRPAQLKRAMPTDVDLRRGIWWVRPAKGGNPIPVILTADMRAAFKAFRAANAWGYFDGSDYAKALYAAGWPKHIPPYNAKHTVAITLGESGAEWEDIKDWFGHKDIKTTQIYTGMILKRFRKTSARLEGRLKFA